MEVHLDLHRVVGWICVDYTNFKHTTMDFHCFDSSTNMLLKKQTNESPFSCVIS